MSETTASQAGDSVLTPNEKAYLLSCFRIGNMLMKNASNPLARAILEETPDLYSQARNALIVLLDASSEELINGDFTEAKDRLNTSLRRIVASLQ